MVSKPVKQKGKEAKENGFDITLPDRYQKAFVTYNIERIREIISRLSPEMCNLFHIPLAFLVDVPGFMIGLEAEKAGTLRAGMRAMFVGM